MSIVFKFLRRSVDAASYFLINQKPFIPDSARNFPVSLWRKALPGFFLISICGVSASPSSASSEYSEGSIFTSSSFSRELMISFARDSREFSNLVPSLIVGKKG